MYLASALQAAPAPTAAATCQRCPARAQAICATLPEAALDPLVRLGRSETLARGESLFWESDAADLVATVRTGVLKLTASLDDGREQILGVALPGDFVGRPFGRTSGYCATAIADTRLCVFRREPFDTLASAQRAIEHALLLRSLDELDRARRWMLLLGRKSARERVASLLLEFADRLAVPAGEVLPLPVTRQQMADLLGLTIETVSRKMTELRAAGAIRLPDARSVEIADRGQLVRLAGG